MRRAAWLAVVVFAVAACRSLTGGVPDAFWRWDDRPTLAFARWQDDWDGGGDFWLALFFAFVNPLEVELLRDEG